MLDEKVQKASTGTSRWHPKGGEIVIESDLVEVDEFTDDVEDAPARRSTFGSRVIQALQTGNLSQLSALALQKLALEAIPAKEDESLKDFIDSYLAANPDRISSVNKESILGMARESKPQRERNDQINRSIGT